MAARSDFDHRRREVRTSLLTRIAGRLFTRKTTGFDGLVKRQLTKRVATVELDPELQLIEEEMRGQTGEPK